MTAGIRIGFGFDSHRSDPSRPLVLGGVRVDGCPGLSGHSDADVLTHAVIDAILAASGGGDIGERFPDTDERWRNARSLELLRQVLPAGFEVVQLDITLVCDRPRILPLRESVISSLKSVVGAGAAVSLKGKTTEGSGLATDGIVAFALALLVPRAHL